MKRFLTAVLISGALSLRLFAGACDGLTRSQSGVTSTCTVAPAGFVIVSVRASGRHVPAFLVRIDFKNEAGQTVGTQEFPVVTHPPVLIVLADPTLGFEQAVKMPAGAVDVKITVKEFRVDNRVVFAQ